MMTSAPAVPSKKDRLLTALENGVTMIHADARRPGVSVPAYLSNQFHLRLNLSYRFDPPDLEVSDWGIRSTLSFSGVRFKVAVPWSAIFAISSNAAQGVWAFPADIPQEVLAGIPVQHPTAAEKPVRQRPRLQLVPTTHEDDEG